MCGGGTRGWVLAAYAWCASVAVLPHSVWQCTHITSRKCQCEVFAHFDQGLFTRDTLSVIHMARAVSSFSFAIQVASPDQQPNLNLNHEDLLSTRGPRLRCRCDRYPRQSPDARPQFIARAVSSEFRAFRHGPRYRFGHHHNQLGTADRRCSRHAIRVLRPA